MAHRTSFPSVAELVPGVGELRAIFRTSMGDFTVRLLEAIAPNTVSSFVGLATGKGEWIDPRTGQPGSGPFYDGVVFHRVIAGFVIQGGDRLGTGRGDPGYRFDDECSPAAKHTRAGIEENLWDAKKGGPRLTSVQMIEKNVRMARELGREIATGEDARRILKIGVWYDTVEETLFNAGLPPNRPQGQTGFLLYDTDGRVPKAAAAEGGPTLIL